MDDNDKPISIKDFALAKRAKIDEQTMQQVWEGVHQVWTNYSVAVENTPTIKNSLNLSSHPTAVFSVLLEQLVSYALTHDEISKEYVMECLLSMALTECEPKGRLKELVFKASNLLEDGDEDSWEKAIRQLHADGKITDEQLKENLDYSGE